MLLAGEDLGVKTQSGLLLGVMVLFGCSSEDGARSGDPDSDSGVSSGGTQGSGGTSPDAGGSAGGSTGNGGSTASGGTGGMQGTGGSGGSAPRAHCSPGTSYEYPYAGSPALATNCYLAGNDIGIPNDSFLFIDDIALSEPLRAGESSSFSVEMTHTGSEGTLELWGADERCGQVSELLYWGPLESNVLCATFTPTAAHSHLVMVMRPFDGGNFSAEVGTMTVCGVGSTCPSGSNGSGLSPGVTLAPPLGNYSGGAGSIAGGGGWVFDVGTGGRMVLFVGSPSADLGVPRDVTHGFFRMPSADAFGDAWYCAGTGSTMTRFDLGEGFDVSLQNITRLSCLPSGTDTVSVTAQADYSAVITSSFPELAGAATVGDTNCNGLSCAFRYYQASTSLYSFVELTTLDDVGTSFNPTRVNAAVSGARWITAASNAPPVKLACGNGGTVLFDPDATTTVSVDGMSAFAACPGAPVTKNTLSFHVE